MKHPKKATRGSKKAGAGKKPVAVPVRQSKKDTVLNLLKRPNGATLQELMTATGWQAHTVRGFISGTARKRLGLSVERMARDGMSAYCICR